MYELWANSIKKSISHSRTKPKRNLAWDKDYARAFPSWKEMLHGWRIRLMFWIPLLESCSQGQLGRDQCCRLWCSHSTCCRLSLIPMKALGAWNLFEIERVIQITARNSYSEAIAFITRVINLLFKINNFNLIENYSYDYSQNRNTVMFF